MDGDLQRQFGRNLRAYRDAHGLSQEALADLLGVHRTYMGGIERGERNLTLRSIERLLERLELEPLTMLRETAAPRPADGATAGRRLVTDCWILQEGSCAYVERQASGSIRLRAQLGDDPVHTPAR